MVSVLEGLLLIDTFGRYLAGSTMRGRGWLAPAAGILLSVIGSVGVFFGKLIRFAVSRECEYLADASAVQFTRNPAGLAGALKKIGGVRGGRGSITTTPRS
jgi:Zn-dependent protease with chaperone function